MSPRARGGKPFEDFQIVDRDLDFEFGIHGMTCGEGNDGLAKFWLAPVSVAATVGYSPRETYRIRQIVEARAPDVDRRLRFLRQASATMTRPTIKHVRTDDDRLTFELDDAREVSLPIATSARLAAATAAERSHWRIGAHGMFVQWPDVDEDIAIWEVLGIPEEVYLRSFGEAPVS